jgi:hypothetical protein
MPKRSSKQKDTQQLARHVLDSIVPDAEPKLVRANGVKPDAEKDPAAVALGRKGGLKGGKARAAKMTKQERSESAKKAAQARWKKP